MIDPIPARRSDRWSSAWPVARPAGPLVLMLVLMQALVGCDRADSVATAKQPILVRVQTVQMVDRTISIVLTGDVQARTLAQLSFRVTGRVTERLVDVGAHVEAGDVLARLAPTEQQADLAAATAAVAAAESRLKVATANFERQKTLLAKGFTTRAAYDQAQEALGGAKSALEVAKAQLGTAKDALTYTELRASAAGVITVRNLEAGQVAQAALSVFTLAQDGDRDAVFDVHETFFREAESDRIALALVSDPAVTATGHVREISPTVDPKTGTVHVKVAIENPPAAMTLGSPVTGTATWKPEQRIVLPWSALAAVGATPAVWRLDRVSKTVSLKTVTVDDYGTGTIVISHGLAPGDVVVVEGGKLLSPGQIVTYDAESRS